MQDEYRITLLERIFDRHMMAVSDRIGLENARTYARNVQGRIESAASIAGVSLLIVVILIIGMTGLDEETLGSLLLASVLVIILSIIHLVSIRRFRSQRNSGYLRHYQLQSPDHSRCLPVGKRRSQYQQAAGSGSPGLVGP